MIAIVAILLFFGAGLLVAGLRRIPEDMVCTVHRFGRYARTLKPGLRFTLPFIDRIAHRVRLVGHQIELPSQSGRAGDAACGALYYQILEPERTGMVLDDVDARVQREACAWLASLSCEQGAPAEPAALASRLKSDLNQRLAELGLRVTRCQLRLDGLIKAA